MTTSKKIILVILASAGAMIGAGCSTTPVQPWQRATLADYTMRADRDPLATAGTEHTYFSRESANGGRGVGGSGCGCN